MPHIRHNTKISRLKRIKVTNDGLEYFDKNMNKISDGDLIKWGDGHTEKVYLTKNGFLGTDVTNPQWIEDRRAVPCEYRVYPFTYDDLENIEVVK